MSDSWAIVRADFAAHALRHDPRIVRIEFSEVSGEFRATIEAAVVWQNATVSIEVDKIHEKSAFAGIGMHLADLALMQLPPPEIVIAPPWARGSGDCVVLESVPHRDARARALEEIAKRRQDSDYARWRVYRAGVLWWTHDTMRGMRDYYGRRERLPDDWEASEV